MILENQTALVSIIIPIYNAAKYLDDCLESIVNQTYQNLEIILINDGSIDDSLKLAKKWEAKDHRIQIINQQNHGVSFSRNQGIELAKGIYISFIDADDVIAEDFVYTLINSLNNTQSDCAVCNIDNFQSGQPILFSNGDIINYQKDEASIKLFENLHGFMANKMYKMSIIKNNNIRLNIDIAISEDLLFNIEYFNYIKKIVYNTGIKYRYRQHGESAFNRLNNTKWFSVLNTMEILLQSGLLNNVLRKQITNNYIMLTYEAKYRLKYCNNIPYDVISNIKKGEIFANQYINTLKLKQQIKIYLMRFLPKLAMKYKRRNII